MTAQQIIIHAIRDRIENAYTTLPMEINGRWYFELIITSHSWVRFTLDDTILTIAPNWSGSPNICDLQDPNVDIDAFVNKLSKCLPIRQ